MNKSLFKSGNNDTATIPTDATLSLLSALNRYYLFEMKTTESRAHLYIKYGKINDPINDPKSMIPSNEWFLHMVASTLHGTVLEKFSPSIKVFKE